MVKFCEQGLEHLPIARGSREDALKLDDASVAMGTRYRHQSGTLRLNFLLRCFLAYLAEGVLKFSRGCRADGLDRAVAHRAGPDAYVTAFHLRDMLSLTSLEQLIAWTAEPVLQVRCRFGKHRGTPWRELDDGFLEWVLERDFDEDVLFTVRHELQRRREESDGEQRQVEKPAAVSSERRELELPF